MKILIVEDQADLADSISEFISQEGYFCDFAKNVETANELLNLNSYDCALVDLMLPDGNGLNVINELKKVQSECGIIIISAKNSVDDKIEGLDKGADDYLAKPFHLSELNARINSVIRRRNFNGNSLIEINELKIDFSKREVTVNKTVIDLTKKEYDLLLFFISNKEKVLTKEAITEHIWGDDSNTFDNLDFVYTHIKNLRKKLTEAGCGDYIRSVYGVGYRFKPI